MSDKAYRGIRHTWSIAVVVVDGYQMPWSMPTRLRRAGCRSGLCATASADSGVTLSWPNILVRSLSGQSSEGVIDPDWLIFERMDYSARSGYSDTFLSIQSRVVL
jgi:hypothetical protein